MVTGRKQKNHLTRALFLFPAMMLMLICGHIRDTFGKGSFSVKPAPSWTIPSLSGSEKNLNSAPDEESGVRILLQDTQIRASGSLIERYYHIVKKAISSAGLEDISQLKLEFEPSFQELTIHQIHIVRNGKVIDALRPKEIKTVQQENELSQQLYNGTLSALIFLNDVREGDIVDYSYSINGENPVLRGRYADFFYLADSDPVDRIRFRLLWPVSRPLKTVNKNTDIQPSIKTIGDQQEYIWDVANTPAVDYEDSLPSWFNPFPRVQVSEFESWNDIIQWALPLYDVKQPPSGALAHQIDQFRAKYQTNEDRLIAALRFVQDEVRYLGIELGPNSHQPTQPSAVFERRFGDCKDKSLLLSTILNSLGIEAHPALVNTETRSELGNLQPNPFAFNHCIVQTKLDGKTYWLDPTINLQRGRLNQYYDPTYAMALVISAGTHDLEKIPDQQREQPTTSVKEKFSPDRSKGTVQLEVLTSYSGVDADEMRNRLKQNSLSEMSRQYLNYYADTFRSIESTEPLNVADDEDRNIITVTEKYEIYDFWKNGRRSISADRIDEELSKPTISKRSWPLGIRYPIYIEQTIEFDMPVSVNTAVYPVNASMTTDAFKLEYGADLTRNPSRLHFRFKTLTDHIPATKVSKHLDELERARNAIWYDLQSGTRESGAFVIKSSENSGFLWIPVTILMLVVGPLVMIGGFRAARASRRRNQFKDRLELAQGDAAATAIPVEKEADIFARIASYRCSCGKDYREPGAIERETFLYDGHRLVVMQLKCISCGNSRDVYFAPSAQQ